MPEANSQKTRAVVLLIVLSMIWGTSFILMKRGLVVFSPGEVGSIRVVSAAIFLFPFALSRLKQLDARHYAKLLASGLMGILFPAFLFASAQTRIDSSVAGILNSLTPICTLLIGVFVFGQQFKARAITGILIGLIGTIILIVPSGVGSVNIFALLVVVACVFYGTNLNFIKYRITDLNALTITSVSVMLIGPLALAYLLGFTDFNSKMAGAAGAWEALGYLVVLGLLSTSVATVLFNKLVKISTPLFTSSVTYLIPVVAVMWGLIDGERLLVGHFIGMCAVIAGVYLAGKK